MGLLITDLARLKGLYEVVGKVVAFLHGKQPCFSNSRSAVSTAQPNEDTSSLSFVFAGSSI